jgi:hypothetical protein
MIRIILAGILGGIAMFAWTSIAHMKLPLGEAGIKELPNEPAVLAALQSNLGDKRGLYVFPGYGLGENPTSEQKDAAMKHMDERLAQNPSGLLMYFPPGRKMSMPRLLGVEFATECLEAILAAFLLSQTVLAGFGKKFGFVFVVGVIAAIATNVSYWNWHGFPKHYTASYMLIQVVGFAIVGLIAGSMVKTRAA